MQLILEVLQYFVETFLPPDLPVCFSFVLPVGLVGRVITSTRVRQPVEVFALETEAAEMEKNTFILNMYITE